VASGTAEREIQRADPTARQRLVAQFALIVAVGGIVLLLAEHLRPAVLAWVMADAGPGAGRRAVLVVGLLGVACAPVAGFAVFLCRLGARVHTAQRFPLPDTRLVRDTRVLRGTAAAARGRLLQAIGAGLLLATVALLLCVWSLARLLIE
jgi:hypothetical protein